MHPTYLLSFYVFAASKLAQYQIGFPRIQPDFDTSDLWVILVVSPDCVTKHRTAVVSMDHAQSVDGSAGPAQLGVDRCDRLRPRHVVNVKFKKSAERNADHLLALSNACRLSAKPLFHRQKASSFVSAPQCVLRIPQAIQSRRRSRRRSPKPPQIGRAHV